jgi:hypothetical protein
VANKIPKPIEIAIGIRPKKIQDNWLETFDLDGFDDFLSLCFLRYRAWSIKIRESLKIPISLWERARVRDVSL